MAPNASEVTLNRSWDGAINVKTTKDARMAIHLQRLKILDVNSGRCNHGRPRARPRDARGGLADFRTLEMPLHANLAEQFLRDGR